MTRLPSGTITFLFTDIEGSTRLWEEHPESMRLALARHDEILRGAIESHGGTIFQTAGDGFHTAFSTAADAAAAALEAQRQLKDEGGRMKDEGSEPAPVHPSSFRLHPLKVRMALHTGAAERREGEYFGPPVDRALRLLDACHGGQIVLSLASEELVRDHLPPEADLKDLGEHRLKDLARPERVFQLLHPDLPAEFPPLRTLDLRPNNLPVQRTSLVGREAEVAAVRELLLRGDVGLVTLTGPGGTGKTRLGLQVAAELADAFIHGVFLVQLAAISQPDRVASAIAQALGVQETEAGSLVDTLCDHLRDRQLLLLLDNFEQVIPAAPLVADLLAGAPRLKVLVTSRAALRVSGEHEFPVPPLALPPLKGSRGRRGTGTGRRPGTPAVASLSQYAAVELFIQRAQMFKPDFQITNENAPAVAEICAQLDGLPLAIELAAVRIKLMTPQAILDRLEHRLALLTGGGRDLPARQQTLRGAISWSYDLLHEEERALFRRLAVFVGGFTLEAAEAVAGVGGWGLGVGEGRGSYPNPQPPTPNPQIDVLEGVASLSDNSLLRQEEAPGTGDPRFSMLETIREFGLERLAESGEEAAIREEHLEWFLALAERAEPELHGPERGVWLERLEAEHDNLRAALSWSAERGAWSVRDATTRSAGTPPTPNASLHPSSFILHPLRLAGALGWFWHFRGYWSEGREWLEQVLEAAGGLRRAAAAGECRDPKLLRPLEKVLYGAGRLAFLQDDYAAAHALLCECAQIARESGDRRELGYTLDYLSRATGVLGDRAAARQYQEESVSVFRAAGDKAGLAHSLIGLASIAYARDDRTAARAHSEESLLLSREIGDKWGIGFSLLGLVRVALLEGDYRAARALAEERLKIFRQAGHKSFIASTVQLLGVVARCEGDYGRAEALCQESLSLFRELGRKTGISGSLLNLGHAALDQGDLSRARTCYAECLSMRRDVGDREGIAEGLEGFARLSLAEGKAERAARLFGAAWAIRQQVDVDIAPVDRPMYERAVAEVRESLEPEGFQAAWAAGREMALDAAVALALAAPA